MNADSGKPMHSNLTELTYDVRLGPGESLSLPKEAVEILGPGHWVVPIRPANQISQGAPVRHHAAFLNSYAPEDEGLYDDYSAG